MKMKEYYYYFRNGKRQPVITICLLISKSGDTARGISICSTRDIISKRIGRIKAFGMAKKALVKRTNSESIKRQETQEIINTLDDVFYNDIPIFTFRSVFNPVLTEYEKVLI